MPTDKVRVSRVSGKPVRSKWEKKVSPSSGWSIITDAPKDKLVKVWIEWEDGGVEQKLILRWRNKYKITFFK